MLRQANFQALRKVTVRCDHWDTDTCNAYVALNHADKAIMMAYRGTIGQTQMVYESLSTVFQNRTAWVAGGTVSTYFFNAFTAVWNGGIKDAFLSASNKYKDYELWVFYNNDMTTADYVECDEGESLECSDQYVDRSFNDHHRYFNVYISSWGEVGCTGDPVNPSGSSVH
ncbi:hypothetical protein NECAME_12009 [Necator americanus]|uniref:Fungal lipase-type domain-containing protein n=1 Tax=Necator americanus TaxID=51031 RepID=W2T323_NECAM|nr:hypothetical protein NECAME_12009 [Necator americanus]ETN75964.1 hypothetical protein NECAME_12009 [Necator americanus]